MYGGTLEAQARVTCTGDHTCIRSEGSFALLLCGKKVGGFTTVSSFATIPVQFLINSHSFVSDK